MRLTLGFWAQIDLPVAQLADLRVLLRIIASMLNRTVYVARQHGIATHHGLSQRIRLVKRVFDWCNGRIAR
jgi:hypothetical protein